MWAYKTAITNWNAIVSVDQYTNGLLWRLQQSTDNLWIGGINYDWNPAANFPLNQWNHIALVRYDNVFKILIRTFVIAQ